MIFDNLSGCDLIGLSSSLSILLSQDLTADELATLAAFFTSFADNLAILALKKEKEDSNNRNPSSFSQC